MPHFDFHVEVYYAKKKRTAEKQMKLKSIKIHFEICRLRRNGFSVSYMNCAVAGNYKFELNGNRSETGWECLAYFFFMLRADFRYRTGPWSEAVMDKLWNFPKNNSNMLSMRNNLQVISIISSIFHASQNEAESTLSAPIPKTTQNRALKAASDSAIIVLLHY